MDAKEAVEAQTLTEEMRSNKSLIKLVVDIREANKQRDIVDRDVMIHQQEIQRLREVSVNLQAEMQKLLYSAAILVMQLRDVRNRDVDRIFLGEEEEAGQSRQTMAELMARLRFLYDLDPMVPPSEEQMQIIRTFTPTWNIPARTQPGSPVRENN